MASVSVESTQPKQSVNYWRDLYARCKRRLVTERSVHRDKLARLKAVYKQKYAAVREKLAKQYQGKLDSQRKKYNSREEALKKRIIEMESELKLYRDSSKGGGKSEKGDFSGTKVDKKKSKKKGGKPKGTRGGRRPHTELPEETIVHQLEEEERACKDCGGLYEDSGMVDETQEVDYEVKLVRKVHKRKLYVRRCRCKEQPPLLRAPLLPKAMSKSQYSDSLWIDVLVKKYGYQIPVTRIIGLFASEGLKDVKGPCLCAGIERMSVFLEPIYKSSLVHSKQASHWHSDGSSLPVFIPWEEKSSFNCCLWLYKTTDTVVFIYAANGKAESVKSYFENIPREGKVISADRAAVYKTLDFLIAFCWAHIRRDFIKVGRYAKGHRTWAISWLTKIRQLYRFNNARIENEAGSAGFKKNDRQLRQALQKMEQAFENELANEEKLPEKRRKVLSSLKRHWDGARLFVDRPEIPMDNNLGEQEFRDLAKMRNNSNGVFSEKFAKITAMMLSIFATLKLNGVNARAFLRLYFEAVALNGSKPLKCVEEFLPWSLSKKVCARLESVEGAQPKLDSS